MSIHQFNTVNNSHCGGQLLSDTLLLNGEKPFVSKHSPYLGTYHIGAFVCEKTTEQYV